MGNCLNNGGEVLSNGNAPSMLDLPTDVISDILSRLPFKTLLNCKCVCKFFLEIISEPYFYDLRIKREHHSLLLHSYPPGEFFLLELGEGYEHTNSEYHPVKFRPGFNLPTTNLSFIGSCNGLLCFCDCSSSADTIYLCNPIVGKYVSLPMRKRDEGKDYAYGFGFSPVTKKYKVIRVSIHEFEAHHLESEIEIFTLGTKAWRSIEIAPCQPPRGSMCKMFYINGSLHWNDFDEVAIYAFDLDEERIRYIPLPLDMINENYIWMKLRVLGGCLCIFDDSGFDWTDIWVMKEYGNETSWTKIRVMKTHKENLTHEPIAYREGGEIFFSIDNLSPETSPFASYDQTTKQFSECEIYITDGAIRAFSYVPSFLKLEDVSGKE